MVKVGDKVRIVDIGGELVNSISYAHTYSIESVSLLDESDVDKEGIVTHILSRAGFEMCVIKLDDKSVIMFEYDEFQDGTIPIYFELV